MMSAATTPIRPLSGASLEAPAPQAQDNAVYTIGAYDEAFRKHAVIMKLGPLKSSEVPASLPKNFLEKDGSYGGGEVFATISKARDTMSQQIASGILPSSEKWHIYLLEAEWQKDTYQIHPNDFRLNRTVKVLMPVEKE